MDYTETKYFIFWKQNKEAKMAAKKKTKSELSNRTELIDALDAIEKEKQISKDVILEALENSLLAACKNQYGKSDNIRVSIHRDTGEVGVYADYCVVEDEELEDPVTQMTLTEAKEKFGPVAVGDTVSKEVTPRNFGRIAAQKAKQVVVQKIREEERMVLSAQFRQKEREVITGIVQRVSGRNVYINLGKVDAVLMESEQVPGEHFRPTEHIKLYVVEVKDTTRGPRITVSRTHPEFVKRLFETEVTELQDGIVEIKNIAREAGSRTKMAVVSNDKNVDPVRACVGVNGARVNAIVNELRGEKIDIVVWDEDPAILIENALSPAKVDSVTVEADEHSARVIVPENQLSLAIGREGQNARLAAKLTGYKIDIKCQ
jgi:N utilization substance protein A